MDERKKIYSETRKDLLNRQLSNTENFDKAIISLSTAGLGLSLAFIKDVVKIPEARYLVLLYFSWSLFGVAIVSTILSFVSSQSGINKQLYFAEKYYLEEKEEFINKRNWQAQITNYLNIFSGIVFVGAIILTVIFVISNIGGHVNYE